MAKTSLQSVSNDVIFVHTNTHIRTVKKHKDKILKTSPSLWLRNAPQRDVEKMTVSLVFGQ